MPNDATRDYTIITPEGKGKMDFYTTECNAQMPQLLTSISSRLNELGYVKEGHAAALCKREKEWPTGLSLKGGLNLAIPHADIEHSLRPVIVVVKNPVEDFIFHKMDAPDEALRVRLVFMFAVQEAKDYSKFLSDMVAMFQDEPSASMLKEGDLHRIACLLKDKLSEYKLVYRGDLWAPRPEGTLALPILAKSSN